VKKVFCVLDYVKAANKLTIVNHPVLISMQDGLRSSICWRFHAAENSKNFLNGVLGDMGRFLIIVGFLVVVMGVIIHFKVEVPWLTGWIGKLPGDLVIKKGNMTLYLPLTTSVLLSIALSLLISLFKK
jgi:hypothetical protein